MGDICHTCRSYVPGTPFCKDAHNQFSGYLSGIPSCLRDNFPEKPWPFWLDESGKPKLGHPCVAKPANGGRE